MALNTSSVVLPTTVATAVVNKAKDTSTVAALSPSSPQIFNNSDYLLFSGSSEAEVVGEGAVKSSYEETLEPVVAKRFKVQTTTRVTNELQWADADNRLQIISQIQLDQAQAMGRALDYVVYHAVNPKTGALLDGYTPLSTTAQQVTATDNPTADIDTLTDSLEDYDINGIALSKTFTAQLRKIRVANTGARLYPEIPMNLVPGNLDGITAATSGTVNGRRAAVATKVLAFCGDFSVIRWGMVRNLTASLIPYGDPDQTGVDLQAHNQVAYRTEAVYAYAVLDPHALAVLKSA